MQADTSTSPRRNAMNLPKLTAHPRFLQRVLLTDAVATGATTVLLLGAADALAPLLELPAGLLRGAGAVLVPFVAWVALLARHTQPPRAAMAAVVAINVAWVVASALIAFGGAWSPNALGVAFVLVQAAAVLVFADLGWLGLRAPRRRREGIA
jgi:hypothetical protein